MLVTYVYFLTSLNYALKLLVGVLFFNELEPCGNIARQSYNKDVSFKMSFFMGLASFVSFSPDPLACKLGTTNYAPLLNY